MMNLFKKVKGTYLKRLENKENEICENLTSLNAQKKTLHKRIDELSMSYSTNYKYILEYQKQIRILQDSMNLMAEDLKRVRRKIRFFS